MSLKLEKLNSFNSNRLTSAKQSPLVRGILLLLCSLSVSAIAASYALPKSDSEQKPNQLSAIASEDRAIPHYEHIFVIVAENKAYNQIMGNINAPNINRLAQTYGLATNFYGVVHPSEANYIAMLGGSTFGIHDDDAYYCQAGSSESFCPNSHNADYANHTIDSKSLLDQLEQKGLTWKGYFESIPSAGAKEVVYPSEDNALYASKHNGFINFKRVQEDPQIASKIVNLNQLSLDLQSDRVPNYSQIIFNQCHEMHGLSTCSDQQQLIKMADMMIGSVVKQITNSSLWSSSGNNAIVITWDEDDNPQNKTEPQGCCGFDLKSSSNFGGGHIPTIVITNHGPRSASDPTPYNHYSLLRTTEDALGIYEYLNEAGNTAQGVKPMTALFARSE